MELHITYSWKYLSHNRFVLKGTNGMWLFTLSCHSSSLLSLCRIIYVTWYISHLLEPTRVNVVAFGIPVMWLPCLPTNTSTSDALLGVQKWYWWRMKAIHTQFLHCEIQVSYKYTHSDLCWLDGWLKHSEADLITNAISFWIV